MKLTEGHYYECLTAPMPNFTVGKDYEVFTDEFSRLMVYPDNSVKRDAPVAATDWIDSRNFVDVTHKYK